MLNPGFLPRPQLGVSYDYLSSPNSLEGYSLCSSLVCLGKAWCGLLLTAYLEKTCSVLRTQSTRDLNRLGTSPRAALAPGFSRGNCTGTSGLPGQGSAVQTQPFVCTQHHKMMPLAGFCSPYQRTAPPGSVCCQPWPALVSSRAQHCQAGHSRPTLGVVSVCPCQRHA